jgi:general secretion pathway protein E
MQTPMMVSESLAYNLYSLDQQYALGAVQDGAIAIADKILHRAIEHKASDIHLQPHEQALMVRERIDGHLYDVEEIDKALAPLLISRIKVLAKMDIAKRRLPQDGRLNLIFHETINAPRTIDMRISSFPTLHGEKLVLRILDQSTHLLSFDGLGLAADMQQQLLPLLAKPHGLFLVTGPTGCGKTTMLYAMLTALNQRSKNLVTIEDPIEYELQGVAQSQINTTAGFTFDVGLRALLRQDPDIMMVGEIRDKQTAQIAIEAALTGHLVLSTLHTNDALSAVVRLTEMGIEPFLISATLIGVLAQRLVRRLCPLCKQKQAPTAFLADRLAKETKISIHEAYAPNGCSDCMRVGFKGQIGIYQLLCMNSEMATCVAKEDHNKLAQLSRLHGLKSLLDDGIKKVEDGITSLDEILAAQ